MRAKAAILAAACLCSLTALGAPAAAQRFEVPEGFIVVPDGDRLASDQWESVLTVRPEEGPFSELSTISLRKVRGNVADPDGWLAERLTARFGEPESVEQVFTSPDSPFADPAFDVLRKSLPELFKSLQQIGRLPLQFCEHPTSGYNASGEFRELFCTFNFGPVRQFVVLRLQDTEQGWYFTEMRTMNERRLRHLTAIANSFAVSR